MHCLLATIGYKDECSGIADAEDCAMLVITSANGNNTLTRCTTPQRGGAHGGGGRAGGGGPPWAGGYT